MSWERSVLAGNEAKSESDNSRILLVSGDVAWAEVLFEVVERVRLADDVNEGAWQCFGGIMLRILRC